MRKKVLFLFQSRLSSQVLSSHFFRYSYLSFLPFSFRSFFLVLSSGFLGDYSGYAKERREAAECVCRTLFLRVSQR